MEKKVNVNLKMDSELKKDMKIICKDMGFSLSTAWIIFCKAVIREGKMPFEDKLD